MVKLPEASLPDVYVECMHEIKVRMVAARHELQVASDRREQPGAHLHAEFSYLQIRRVIELWALALLVTHNEIEDFQSKKFVREWHPKNILAKLTAMNANAFPEAFEVHEDGELTEFQIIKDGHLTKDELIRIYNACGDKLHVGSLKQLVKSTKVYDLGEASNWLNSLFRLLKCHAVFLPEMKKSMLIFMSYGPEGNVHCIVSDLMTDSPEEKFR